MDTKKPPMVSLNNGLVLLQESEITEAALDIHWEALTYAMEDDAREAVHAESATLSKRDFLKAYLARATHNLVIG